MSGQSATPTFSLLYGDEFALDTANCVGGITNCTVTATFIPKYAGIRKDVVVIRDNGGNLIGRMALSGTGKGPQVSVSPGAMTQLHLVVNGTPFPTPSGFVLDGADNIYAIVYNSNQVFKISSLDQSVRVVAGQSGSIGGYSGDGGLATSAQLNFPRSLALDSTGNLYIADSGNNVIRKLDTVTGIITTVAGNGVQGHTDAGAGASAELTTPFGLVCDSAGNLYFLEQGDYTTTDYKIREWDAATQTISVIAGTGAEGDSGDNGSATQAVIDLLSLGIDASGNIYFVQQSGSFTETGGIIRVISGGIVSAFAGSTSGQTTDGAPALATDFQSVGNLVFGANGSMYLTESAEDIRILGAAAPHIVSTMLKATSNVLDFLARDSLGDFYASDDVSVSGSSRRSPQLSFSLRSTPAKPAIQYPALHEYGERHARCERHHNWRNLTLATLCKVTTAGLVWPPVRVARFR